MVCTSLSCLGQLVQALIPFFLVECHPGRDAAHGEGNFGFWQRLDERIVLHRFLGLFVLVVVVQIVIFAPTHISLILLHRFASPLSHLGPDQVQHTIPHLGLNTCKCEQLLSDTNMRGQPR